MITGGFGVHIDIATGRARQWYCGKDGVKRWLDNDQPVEHRTAEESSIVKNEEDE